jgi:light-regulated signal transduction histidine kinase (bacteriophytochrome)
MLNATLKQHISCYLGNHEIVSPRLAGLFNCISEWYNEMENRQLCTLNSKSDNAVLLDQLSDHFAQLAAISGNTTKFQNKISIASSSEKNQQMLTDTEDCIHSLLTRIQKQLSEIKANTVANENRLAEMEKKNNDLDKFAYTVSHDLKSPLRAIASLAQWIEDDLGTAVNDVVKDHLVQLRNRIFRMEDMINAILAYSKSSRTGNEFQLTDTGSLIRDVINSMHCPDNISIQLKGRFPVILTEAIKLQQVFANLLNNSIKFMDKETGVIEAGFFETEDQCQFYIHDNGPGIDKDFQHKAFLLFHSYGAQQKSECNGVGLAIVKRIIDETGGKIWIESEKGKGAKFVFTWPKQQNKIKNTSHV